MKAMLSAVLIGLLTYAAFAQTAEKPKHHHKTGATNDSAGAEGAGGMPPPDPAVDQAKQIALFQKSFVPTDPWRVMNEKTNFAKGGDWVQFEGRVQSVSTEGIVLQGWFGEPLAYMDPKFATTGTTFNLSNYPRHVAIGQMLSRYDRLMALKAATKNDLPNLDYGEVWVPQLTEEQKAQATQAKSQTQNRVLAFHQELADKGDAYGEYKMGVRYETGDGVDKDLQKARDLLNKSAAQGYKDATDELAKLPATN